MTQVLIADGRVLVRAGLRRILQGNPRIKTIYETSSGEDAIVSCRRRRPDVVVMNLHLPGLTAFEVTCRIRRNGTKPGIVVLAEHAKAPYPTRLLSAGANAYLTKDCDSEELLKAISAAALGQRYVGTEASKQLALSMFPGRPESPFEELSARELEVMMKLAEGDRVPEIARVLCLSPKTVATYKYRIYQKVGTRSEVGLLRMALRYGLVEAG